MHHGSGVRVREIRGRVASRLTLHFKLLSSIGHPETTSQLRLQCIDTRTSRASTPCLEVATTMSLPTSDLFNQPTYSDVIISFSGRRIYCHKLILCSKSEYFKKLCDPDGGFSVRAGNDDLLAVLNETQESTQKVIELRDDDPDAVEHILRYIYTGKHLTDQDREWKLQLQIANSAHKASSPPLWILAQLTLIQYLLTDLANAALGKFKTIASGKTDPPEVFGTMMHIPKHTLLPEALDVAKHLESTHRHSLLKVPAYRELVDEDNTLLWKYLDQFNDALAAQTEVTLRVCRKCRTPLLLANGNSGTRCRCSTGYSSPNYEQLSIWVPTAKFDDYVQRLPEYR